MPISFYEIVIIAVFHISLLSFAFLIAFSYTLRQKLLLLTIGVAVFTAIFLGLNSVYAKVDPSNPYVLNYHLDAVLWYIIGMVLLSVINKKRKKRNKSKN